MAAIGAATFVSAFASTATAADATAVLWSSAGGSAWLTGTNWTGGSVPTGTEIAQFGVNPTSSVMGVGINFHNTTNAGPQIDGQRVEEVGAIELTAARTANLVIGNSSTTSGASGTLRLNGVTVNGVANVILHNDSPVTLAIHNIQGSGTESMALELGNAVDNVINIDSSGSITIDNVIKDGAGNHLTLGGSGSGMLVLFGTSTYTGGTTITGGRTLVLGNATDTLSSSGLIDIVSGTLSLGNNSDAVGNVTLEIGSIAGTGGTLTATNYDFRSGTVSVNLAGSGTALFKSSSGGLSLTGTNSYTGGTTINGGDVTFNNSSALGTGAINFGPNGLDSMSLISTTAVSLSNDITINDLSPTPGRTATLGSFAIGAVGTNAYTGNITLNNTLNLKSSSSISNPLTFSTGIISGTGGLIINPSGTLSPGAVKLAGNNTYAGNTTITQGSLLVTGGVVGSSTNSGTGTGNVSVSGTGTILAGGSTSGTTGSILGTLSIGAGSKLSPGTSGDGTSTTAIFHTGALTLSSGSTLRMNINGLAAGSSYDQVISSGAINLSGSTLSLTASGSLAIGDKFFILENSSALPNGAGVFTNGVTVSSNGYSFLINYADNGDGGITFNDISLTVTAAPEPSTFAGAALALAALVWTQRERVARLLKRAL